ncbi:MAG: response regulator transcription factor [Bacteroidales bacterium]|jgi:two-component system alkaline phosphatase synthesis response regulator PhoP|nr:response regulator transcription factor [Bacteroidales bacterium]
MAHDKYKILLVDDEPDILEFLSYNLKKEGYEVFTASGGNEAIETALAELPHLILMDVMMPGKDGVETCEEMRTHSQLDNCIIAFLTARAEDYSQIAGFEAGADDYINKPIKPKVLQTRIKALLKRYDKSDQDKGAVKATTSASADLVIDKERFVVIKKGEELTLPKKEFELLALLMSRPEKVFGREEIFNLVWGDDIVVGDRTIDVHIRKLREKIGDKHIKTLKGVGYKFVERQVAKE